MQIFSLKKHQIYDIFILGLIPDLRYQMQFDLFWNTSFYLWASIFIYIQIFLLYRFGQFVISTLPNHTSTEKGIKLNDKSDSDSVSSGGKFVNK